MFEMPKFDIPKFDMPKMEVPAAFREFAEKGVAQTKEAYEKMKATAEAEHRDARDLLFDRQQGLDRVRPEDDRDRARQHQRDFDFVESLFGVKSPSELVELSTAHSRTQFETLAAQSKELAALAQKVATETAEPIKTGVERR